MTIIIQIAACILMLIDTRQTYSLLKIDIQAEGNPVIKFIFKCTGMYGVMFVKITISIIPFMSPEASYFLLVLYAFVVYHNYTGFKEYETSNSIH